MFDISFTELLVIGVIALIVIGPERLPKVARTLGLLFGRAQRYVNEVKADINNQLKLEELRKIEADLRAKAQNAEHVIIEETQRTEQEFRSAAELAAPEAAAPETSAPAMPEAAAEPLATPSPSSPQLELGLDATRSPAEPHTK